MEKIISASEARKRFAEISDEVRTQGVSYTVVSHGREQVRIVPPQKTSSEKSDFSEIAKRVIKQYDEALTELAKR